MRYKYMILDVFTDEAYGGNPLAVLPEAGGLDEAAMLKIAQEFGFSETSFVTAPENPCYHARVRIFTPAGEVPFAGHPTVGTALALAWLGRVGKSEILLLEEEAGLVAVTLEWEGERAARAILTTPQPPSRGAQADPAAAAAALGLRREQIATGNDLPRDASCGLPFLLVEVRDREALAAARPGRDLGALSPAAGQGVYVFTHDARHDSAQIQARMFAPGQGIPEDPATGSAAAALAGHLAGLPDLADGWYQLNIEQGLEMGRPSCIVTRSLRENDAVSEVQVGGAAVRVGDGELEAPAAE